jgi:2-polyprenyl-6-methoxyphenol hydroxylase-like FAD-dependent oxidoreductase
MQIRTDVVVVGARVAGSATAMLLARLGHDVLLLDRADLPSDTISTHQIARTGVVALRRWGLLETVLATGAPVLRQVTFHADGGSVTRTVKDRFGVDHLVAPRRYVLDVILAEAAVAAGATLVTGVIVTGVRSDDAGRVTGLHGHHRDGRPVEVAARFVVGADGLSSRVARAVGAGLTDDRGRGGATRYAYFAGLPWSGIEFFTEDRSFAGVFPTNDAEACVWVCTPEADARATSFDEQLRHAAPSLVQRLRAARRTSAVRGMLRAPNHIRRAFGAGWALVGDAAYHRDPISAHGISAAFRDAELLAVALDETLSGRAEDLVALASFEAARNAALREVFDLTCALSAYPPGPEFTELMRQLGRAIDTEAATMAARPVPGERLARACSS